jgi:FAD-dependent urate hydroxylase
MTKVLIAGGGIAGPAAAIALRKAGITAEIIEAARPGTAAPGAFLTLTANGVDALRAIGADQPVLDASLPARRLRLFEPGGDMVADAPLGQSHPGPRTITRAALSQALRDQAEQAGIPVRYGIRVTSAAVGPDGRVTADFSDGSRAEADLLIGADGIRSPVRALIDPAVPQPRYTGLMIAYGYADGGPATPEPGSYDMCYGSRGFLGYTTGADGRNWWFARIPAPELGREDAAEADRKQYLTEVFGDDGTPAADLIKATGRVTVTSAYDIPTLPTWHNGAMIVIGDAAHATSPSTTQGASMAIEDGVILGQCLRDLPRVPEALKTFERIRRDRVERVVQSGASAENPAPRPRPSGPRRGDPAEWLFGHHIEWQASVALPVRPQARPLRWRLASVSHGHGEDIGDQGGGVVRGEGQAEDGVVVKGSHDVVDDLAGGGGTTRVEPCTTAGSNLAS